MTRVSDPRDSQPAPVRQPSNGKTILLAEDDPFIARMYQAKLTSAGYAVAIVRNGREAYGYIKATPPDLIMLDINMPELTGFEVIRALQADGLDEIIACIMVLTNSADHKNQALAKEFKVDYLVKAEMTPHEVLARINQKLGVAQT